MASTENYPTVRRVPVLDVSMAVRLAGSGAAIVLLHGNPTSSWLWRHCFGSLATLGRVVAPDLVGMGDSDPLPRSGPGRYRFVEHRRYLDALLDQLDLGHDVVVVGHDWGGVLGLDWARRHEDRIRGIAYMETIVAPRLLADEPPDGQQMFQALRSDRGEQMVLDENFFIDTVLAGAADLDDTDLAVYRRPYSTPGESRRPMLTWAREIPFDGEPADVDQIVSDASRWLQNTSTPKLFIAAEPGAIITGRIRSFCETFPNQHVVEVSAGHFVPEDAPDLVATALSTWVRQL